ncbi:winged helix-turn-helix domain-containing protein [Streptomyces sp. NPDC056517]|uniref:winged helix-turn-helix domain-containing protein n=1 Tax=Streptomyces sp. NPDC056517 TaxID=3345848 RepID=UPI0036A943F4
MRGGTDALRRRPATGRLPKLDEDQVERVRSALEQGAQAYGFEADLWTLERVGAVVMRVTGVTLSRASVWRLLTGRLGWSLQRPERPELFAAAGPPHLCTSWPHPAPAAPAELETCLDGCGPRLPRRRLRSRSWSR